MKQENMSIEQRSVRNAAWDIPAMAKKLGAEPEERINDRFGIGTRFRFGEPQPVELEVFPAAGVVRLTGADLSLTLAHQPGARVLPEGVVFERSADESSPTRFLSVSPRGEVFLALDPSIVQVAAERTERPQEASTGSEQALTPDRSTERVLVPPAASDEATKAPFQTPIPETAERRRVTYVGRLGREPYAKPNRKITVVEVPVAVAVEGREKPDWYQTVAFAERGDKLLELKKGDLIEVVAYEHERMTKGKDGKTRVRKEYRVAHLTVR